MSAGPCTAAEEKRYGLKPLPDIPYHGELTNRAKLRAYEQDRIAYRQQHPHRDRADG